MDSGYNWIFSTFNLSSSASYIGPIFFLIKHPITQLKIIPVLLSGSGKSSLTFNIINIT